MHKILITDDVHPITFEMLRKEGFEITHRALIKKEELLEIVGEYHAIITRSQTAVDKDIIDRARLLKVIGRAAIGVDNIDLEYATKKGILVVNVPADNVISAAEHTFALLLSAIRNINAASVKLKEGVWTRKQFDGMELSGKTLGIVGLGKVGSHVATIARGFGMKVLAYDPYIGIEKFERFQVERKSSLIDLLPQVDILSVHTPKTKETIGLLDYLTLKEMKKGSVLINCARGGIVDEDGLLRLLQDEHLYRAGVDVFNVEPNQNHPLFHHQRCVCTPHLGASTHEAQARVGKTIAIQIHKALKNQIVDHPVNMPFVEDNLFYATRSFCVLAEKMGLAAQQITDFNPAFGRMVVSGKELSSQAELLAAAFFKGYFEGTSEERVNYINSVKIAENMGLSLELGREPMHDTYNHLLRVEIYGDGGPFRIAGTIFGKEKPRIVELNGFFVDWDPEGYTLFLKNRDKPGMIGFVGTELGRSGVNIARWELGRRFAGGEALALISIDQPAPDTTLQALKNHPDILSVIPLKLGVG